MKNTLNLTVTTFSNPKKIHSECRCACSRSQRLNFNGQPMSSNHLNIAIEAN